MGKILKCSEINKKKNEHVTYSESYEVKFWIRNTNGFWDQITEMYFGKTKGEHDFVVNRWKKDYKGQNVKFVSVIYQ